MRKTRNARAKRLVNELIPTPTFRARAVGQGHGNVRARLQPCRCAPPCCGALAPEVAGPKDIAPRRMTKDTRPPRRARNVNFTSRRLKPDLGERFFAQAGWLGPRRP